MRLNWRKLERGNGFFCEFVIVWESKAIVTSVHYKYSNNKLQKPATLLNRNNKKNLTFHQNMQSRPFLWNLQLSLLQCTLYSRPIRRLLIFSILVLRCLWYFKVEEEVEGCPGIFKQSMGARNRVGIRLSYRPARLESLVKSVPWNRFLGSL